MSRSLPPVSFQARPRPNRDTTPSPLAVSFCGQHEPRGGILHQFFTKNSDVVNFESSLFGKALVKTLDASDTHYLVVNGNGSVYSWGDPAHGKLGHEENPARPVLIRSLSVYKIIQVSCGPNHSCALTDEGKVMVWGLTSVPPELLVRELKIPTEINLPKRCIKITSGNCHVAIIDERRIAYSWAWDVKYMHSVTPLHVPHSYVASDLRSGPLYTVLLTDDDKLFTQTFAKISEPNKPSKRPPGVTAVEMLYNYEKSRIVSISCGFYTVAILLENRMLMSIDLSDGSVTRHILELDAMKVFHMEGFYGVIEKSGLLYTLKSSSFNILTLSHQILTLKHQVFKRLEGTICEHVVCNSECILVVSNFWSTKLLNIANGDLDLDENGNPIDLGAKFRNFLHRINADDFCYVSNQVYEAYRSNKSSLLRNKLKTPDIQIQQNSLEFRLRNTKCPLQKELWDYLNIKNCSDQEILLRFRIYNRNHRNVNFYYRGMNPNHVENEQRLNGGAELDLIFCLSVLTPPGVNIIIEITVSPSQATNKHAKATHYVTVKLRTKHFVRPELEIPFTELSINSLVPIAPSVFEANYHGSKVAVKKISQSIDQALSIIEIYREIDIMSKLRHPYLLSLIGVCMNPLCIVTPLMATNLFTILATRNIDLRVRVKWALQIAWGMVHLHSKNILHRDLKSPNILITEDYQVKICDFGQSKQNDMSFTNCLGTQLWRAPEIILNEPYGKPADVFSFSIILYELSTCLVPYSEFDYCDDTLETKIAVERMRMSVQICQPPGIEKYITGYWDHDPSKRPTFLDITVDLEKFYEEIFRNKFK